MGSIEVIVGPMFAGKTTELIRRLTRAEIAGQKIKVFKPDNDDRYKKEKIVTHNQVELDSSQLPQDNTERLNSKNLKTYDVIGIDEGNFFLCDNFVENIQKLANDGKKIIIAGLDTDYKRNPFGVMHHLMAIAERVDKLTAICEYCGDTASMTKLKRNNIDVDENNIVVGGKKIWEPVCRVCYNNP